MVTFLQPGAMLVAAVLLIPLLLALYLLKLRRRPLRVSTTFLWLEATSDLQVNVPLARLRGGLLLILHTLLVLCLIAALGRPALDAPSPGTRQAIIIDASASMGANASGQSGATAGQPPRTRLDRAKDEAVAMLPTLLATGAKVAVVSLASSAELRCGFSTDIAALQEAIEGIAQTGEPGHAERLLPILETLVIPESSSEEDLPPDAVDQARIKRVRPVTATLLTDGCNPAPKGPPLLPAGLVMRQVLIDQPVPVPLSGEPINVGIISIAAKRDERDATVVRLFVRIRSSGAIPCVVPLSVSLDGAPAQSVPAGQLPMLVQVKASTVAGPSSGLGASPGSSPGTSPGAATPAATPAPSPVQPVAAAPAATSATAATGSEAEAVALIDLLAPSGGTITASVGLRDALSVDNSASVVVPAPKAPKVILVVPELKPDPASGPQPGVKPGVTRGRGLTAAAYGGQGGDPIVRALLEEILAGLTPPSTDEPSRPTSRLTVMGEREFRAARAARSLDADLLVFDGVNIDDQADSQTLLAGVSSVHFNGVLPGVQLTASAGGATRGALGATRSALVIADRNDPIMRGVVPDGVIVDVPDGIRLDTAVLGKAGSRAKVLLESTVGPQVVSIDQPGGLRRLVIGFPLRRSSWGTDVSFVVFVSNAVEQLSGSARLTEGMQYQTGSALTLQVPAGAGRTVRLQTQAAQLVGSLQLGPDETTATFPASGRAGVFQLVDPLGSDHRLPGAAEARRSGESARDVAVNLCDAAESELAPRLTAGETDRRWWVGGSDDGSAKDRREPRGLWRELLMACTILLALEWMAFAWQARRPGSLTTT